MTFKLVTERACVSCRYVSSERPQPHVLQSVLVCRWGPPTPMMIPTGPNSANVQPMPPVVHPNYWCYRFEPLPEAGD